ncbi:MAG: hypothetical protein AAGA62_01125, partial [Bacteroidota bacterium]
MTYSRLSLTTLLCFCLYATVASQSITIDESFCGSNAVRKIWREASNAHVLEERKLELEWSQFYKSGGVSKASASPYTIPIVFHLVHENGPENLTDAAIERTLRYVNQAFANTGVYDRGRGVNTQIQFCFAQRTPDNQPT